MQTMQKLNRTLLFINLFFIQAYLIRFQLLNYPTNLQEILIIANCFTFLAANKKLPNIKKHWIILSFFILTAISTATTDIISNIDYIRHLKFLVFGSALTYIFLETLNKKVDQERGITYAGLGAIAFGAFSVIYNLLGFNVAYDLRLLGPLDAAVYLAFYFAPFFIFFTINYLKNKKRSHLFYALILGALLIATRSMGAIGAAFASISIYFFNNSLNKKSKIILSIIGLIIATSIFYTKILPTLNTEYSSLDERGQIWQTSAHLLKEPQTIITGLGLGQFQEHYSNNVAEVLQKEPLDYYVLQPHNIFLLFIFNHGILGLLLLATIIILTFRSKSPYKYIIFYFLIHGLIDTPFYKNDILFIILLFLSLTLNQKPNLSKLLQDLKP